MAFLLTLARACMWGVAQPQADLKPERVVAGVIYLSSPLYQETGYILRASNGQFTATRFCENPGVVYPTDLKHDGCRPSLAAVKRGLKCLKITISVALLCYYCSGTQTLPGRLRPVCY